MSNRGKHSCLLLLSGVGELEWIKPRGKTQRAKITTCAFDVISVSVLECFGWSVIVFFDRLYVKGGCGRVSESEV